MKRFKYNNAIHKIALSAIVASFAGVVACDDVYWDREAYDGFIDTFGVKHPSQFDLNNNVCAYIARESMGIEKLNGSNWQNAIAEYHTQHPNDPIAPECLAQGDSNIAASAPDENGDSTDTQPSNSSENLALYKDPDFLKCLRAQIEIIQSRCDAVSVSKTGDENEGRMYIQVAEDITSKAQLDATIFACAQNDKNKDKNVCSDTATTQEHRNILNYRQCPNGYSLVVDGDKADRTYVCARTVCKSVAVHFETDMLNCGVCGNACKKTQNCEQGSCIDAECRGDAVTCKNVCVNFTSTHVKSCENDEIVCQEHYADCDGDPENGCEASLLTDPNNCGGCGSKGSSFVCNTDKTTSSRVEACVDGTCVINDCNENNGETVCNVNGINTCVVVKGDDILNCGGCNITCAATMPKDSHVVSCNVGVCQYACDDGVINVGDGETADTIQCIDPKTNIKHCGDQLEDCSVNADFVCVEGQCVLNSCKGKNNNETLCVVEEQNLCIDVKSDDKLHCGACNYKCSDHNLPNAKSDKCKDGECQYECIAPYTNIGGHTTATINCVDLNQDNKNCGTVGNICKDGNVCIDGHCKANPCTNSSETACLVGEENKCFNIKATNANHCGACNYKCSEHKVTNATSDVCMAGKCQYTCNTGFVNVGSGVTADTIKCINPYTDFNYCGARSASAPGTDCSAFPGQSCNNGKCQCPDGQTYCEGKCVVLSSVNIKACSNGNISCETGFKRCDKTKVACQDVSQDKANCGECGVSCNDNQSCYKGGCVINKCEGNTTLCDVKNEAVCKDVSSDSDHCGACNYSCATHKVLNATSSECRKGQCEYKCNTGFKNIGSGVTADSINCVNPLSNYNHCGKLDANTYEDCSTKPGTKCVDGVCTLNCPTGQQVCGTHCLNFAELNIDKCNNGALVCLNGYKNVDGKLENGCEVDTMTDNKYCGENMIECQNGYCKDGVCTVSSCAQANMLPCGANGGCVDVVSSESNCGGCNVKCSGQTPACVNRHCVECKEEISCKADSAKPLCNLDTNTCVECLGDGNCKDRTDGKELCYNGACQQCISLTDCDVVDNGLGMACEKGVCLVSACSLGYHPSDSFKSCEADSTEICGAKKANCNDLKKPNSNVEAVACNEGNCEVKSCTGDNHVSADKKTCEADTIKACGPKIDDCTKVITGNVDGVICQGGECKVSTCKEGYEVNGDQTECVEKATSGTGSETGGTGSEPGNGGDGSGSGSEGTGSGADGGTGGTGTGDNGGTESP